MAQFQEKSCGTKCVFRFSVQLLSKTFLIRRRIDQDSTINVRTSSRKVPIIPVRY